MPRLRCLNQKKRAGRIAIASLFAATGPLEGCGQLEKDFQPLGVELAGLLQQINRFLTVAFLLGDAGQRQVTIDPL